MFRYDNVSKERLQAMNEGKMRMLEKMQDLHTELSGGEILGRVICRLSFVVCRLFTDITDYISHLLSLSLSLSVGSPPIQWLYTHTHTHTHTPHA